MVPFPVLKKKEIRPPTNSILKLDLLEGGSKTTPAKQASSLVPVISQ
jgi:hypothetical protein